MDAFWYTKLPTEGQNQNKQTNLKTNKQTNPKTNKQTPKQTIQSIMYTLEWVVKVLFDFDENLSDRC